jgi:hypothetical protein
VLAELDPIVGQFRITYSGSRLNQLEPGFADHCKGRYFGEAYPGAYGEWLTQTLSAVRDADRSSVAFVEATLTFKNRQPKRFFYESLLIPLTKPCGTRQLIAATTVV